MRSSIAPLLRKATERLLVLGVNEEQLAGIQFRRQDPSTHFDCWPFTYPPNIPEEAIGHIKDFLALRMINASADGLLASGAYEHVQELILGHSYSADLAFKKRQSEKGKKRRRLTDDGRSPLDLVCSFCNISEDRDLPAKQLWPHFFHYLNEQGLDPVKISEITFEYSLKNGTTRIAITTFANLVSRARRKKG